MRVAILLSVVASAFALSASGTAGTPRSSTLEADIAEWSIVPSVGVVRAGRIRVVVHNLGATRHQLTLVRTGTFAARLRLAGAYAVARPLAAPVVVRPGGTASFEVSLIRGSYLLVDNLQWSYWKGTSAAFSVR